jgi:isochorismate hydrolase
MLSRQHSLLHIIDIQEKLFNVMHEKEQLRDNMYKLLKGVQILNLPVIWIEQYPQGLGPTIPELKELMPGQKPLEKMCFSSCRKPEFLEELKKKGRNQVLIMGIETHVCVYQTVIGLLDRGYDVRVVADAVSSRTRSNYEFGLRSMENRGAKLTTVEMALFELLAEAGSDQFRKISRLIR